MEQILEFAVKFFAYLQEMLVDLYKFLTGEKPDIIE